MHVPLQMIFPVHGVIKNFYVNIILQYFYHITTKCTA